MRLRILYGMAQDKLWGVYVFFFFFLSPVFWKFIRFPEKHGKRSLKSSEKTASYIPVGKRDKGWFKALRQHTQVGFILRNCSAILCVWNDLPLVNNIESESYHFDVSRVIYISTIIFRNHTGCNFTIELFNLTTLHA